MNEEREMNEKEMNAETLEHIQNVRNHLNDCVKELLDRGVVHDLSKLQSPEVDIFTEYTPRLKGLTYGSDEYKECLKGMQVALDHHYAHNRHHPEYHVNGVDDMNLMDIVEMLADWKAATMRHDDGDIMRSIDINKERFNLSDQMIKIMKNTVNDMGWV
jgi:hypothetical protein